MLNRNMINILPLLLVIVIDCLGMCIIFPVFTPLFMNTTSHLLPGDTSMLMREVLFGFIIGVFPLFMFFGAPFLGDLSDIIGRKKVLLLCLSLTAVSYVLSAIGIAINSLILLYASRGLAGLMAGSQPIAQAVIADISQPENKARNMSMVTFSMSIGTIFGPIVGAYFSDKSLVSWFTEATPFYFAGGLSLFNALFLSATFRETFIPKVKKALNPLKAFSMFLSAFKVKELRALALAFFFLILCWSLYIQSIPLYMNQMFHYQTNQIGQFMSFLGFWFALSLAVLIHYALKWWSIRQVAAISFVLVLLGAVLSVLWHKVVMVWIGVAPITIGAGVAYTVLLTMLSNCVDDQSQGWIMGVTGALTAAAFFIIGLLLGVMTSLSLQLPLYLAAISAIIGLLFILSFRQPKHLLSA